MTAFAVLVGVVNIVDSPRAVPKALGSFTPAIEAIQQWTVPVLFWGVYLSVVAVLLYDLIERRLADREAGARAAADLSKALSRIDEAQQAAARDAGVRSSEVKAALDGLLPAIDGQFDEMAKQAAALQGVPGLLLAVDGRLVEMAKQASEQSGALRQEVQTALAAAVQPAPPAASVERPHVLEVTARMRSLSRDSWTYKTYDHNDRMHAALIGRKFIAIEVMNVGTRALTAVVTRCRLADGDKFYGSWSEQSGPDFKGEHGVRKADLDVQDTRLLLVGEAVEKGSEHPEKTDHLFLRLPKIKPLHSVDFARFELDGVRYREKVGDVDLTVGNSADLAVEFFSDGVHEEFCYRLRFEGDEAQVEEIDRRVIVSPSDSAPAYRYSEGDALPIVRGLEAEERAEQERKRRAALVTVVALYNRALKEPGKWLEHLRSARQIGRLFWEQYASDKEREYENALSEAYRVLSTAAEEPDFNRDRLHAAIATFAGLAGVGALLGEQLEPQPETKAESEPLAYHESVQQLLQVYPPCESAAFYACRFFEEVVAKYASGPHLTKEALVVEMAENLYENKCSLEIQRLSRKMAKCDGLTVAELRERVTDLRDLTAHYWLLLKSIMRIGFVIGGETKVPSEPTYKRLYELNRKMAEALEFVQHRTDIGEVAGHSDTIRRILPEPITSSAEPSPTS